ncbi:MAG: NAD(+) diphosphatase [Lentisphaeria bacterium]|nr:NAD(+) diphosphatase [Lentisphaeria bacterium]
MKKILPFFPSSHLAYDKLPAVAVVFQGDKLLVRRHGDGVFLPCTDNDEFAMLSQISGDALYVGDFTEMNCGVWSLADDCQWQNPADTEFVEIRHAMYVMDQMSVTAVARGKELLFWRHKRQYCGFCGNELVDNANDISRICPDCGNTFYPVMSPAVITAVRRENKLLLAHNARFKEKLYGLVAGFVEAGENLESAVAREVREEVGIEIKNIRYFSSQVWPFPNSLMVGFFADYDSGEIHVDGKEISHADWFSVDEFPEIPRHGSIARTLIDTFCAENNC